MNEEERCNTTLGLGIGAGIKREKHSKPKTWLELSLPLHPKIEGSDHDCKNDDDQDSLSSKTIDDQQEQRGIKRSVSNTHLYYNNDGSRKKLKLTTEQTTLLEDCFKMHSTLNMGQKQELAKMLNLLPRQIEVWFQNRRARTKLKQIKQEYNLLKKCCENLKDENRRLRKELQEVRGCSLKFDHHQPPPQSPLPFYIHYHATTTVHHPCDKIGKSGEETKKAAVVNSGIIGHNHDNSNKKIAIVAELL